MAYMQNIIDEALAEVAVKSQKRIYQHDFNAWSADVLGRRYYEKLREISDVALFGDKTRTAVKSANGCGKSLWLADLVTWWSTAFPPEDSLAIITAPTLHQIQNVMFTYLKNNYGYVAQEAKSDNLPFAFNGTWINESLEWKYAKPNGAGNENIVFGKRPSDQDIVSTFQGTRKARTLIAIDEGGGVPGELFTAAEAVGTGGETVIVTIGNPDKRGTEFHKKFSDPKENKEWNTFTISAYDLPTMTGEIVYPGEPEKQEKMLKKGLTTREWIEHKERVWKVGDKWDARGLAKVLGEFPGETDNTFFPQSAIDRSGENEIDGAGARVIIGADVAAAGSDESVVYVNRGGNVRLFDKEIHYSDGGEDRITTGVWSKEDEVSSARRLHAIATHLGAHELRVDAAGLGGAIFKMLERLDEFSDKCYELFAIIGSNTASDRDQWANKRAENHDSLRRQMIDGLIDLDPSDDVLRNELLVATYALNNRGAVQITPKREMVSQFGGSPDRMDALIYATTEIREANGGVAVGDVVTYDYDQAQQGHFLYDDLASLGW